MNYKELKEIINNNKDIREEYSMILCGYIDYCEKNNIKISEVIKTICDSKMCTNKSQ